MSKYIIEIKPEYEDNFRGVMILGAENSNLYVDSQTVDELEELNSDYINEHFGDLQDTAYKKGFEDGKQTAVGAAELREKLEYQRGLDDAWECAKKLFSTMSETEIEKVFPTEWENGFYGLMQMKPQYAIEKLKAYEKKRSDKITRGDIVNVKGSCNDDLLGVVTNVWEDNCYIMWDDGSGGAWCKDSVFKTGKHIDIDKVFEEMRT